MRQWVVSILVCGALGVVITVAVAWGIAIRPQPSPLHSFFITNPMESAYHYRVWNRNPALVHSIAGATGELKITEATRIAGIPVPIDRLDPESFDAMLPNWSAIRETATTAATGDARVRGQFQSYTEFASGWPMLALRYNSLRISGPTRDSSGLIELPQEWVGSKARNGSLRPIDRRNTLPCIPIWSGFYINALIYAIAAWCVFFAPFKLRHFTRSARRQRKGLCIRCGYDLRGAAHGLCTECGATTR